MLPGYHPLQPRRSLVIPPQVRFVRRADPRTKKDAASRIVQLPQGTVQFEAIEAAVITGEATRASKPWVSAQVQKSHQNLKNPVTVSVRGRLFIISVRVPVVACRTPSTPLPR